MSNINQSCKIHESRLRRLLEGAKGKTGLDYANLHVSQLPRNRTSISYFEFGAPDGRPLLCLHGLSVTGYYFEQYHDYFVETGIRAIAPCLLGGIYIPDSARTIDDLTGEVIELLDILGIHKFDVMGFSWGTLPELALLARVPDRVGRAGFLGTMVPLKFLAPLQIGQLKSDIRLSLKMVKHTPFVYRCLMWLFCRLPVSALINQFKDENLSIAEVNALAPGSSFNRHFSRCLSECLGTGSQFFTHGWRMFLDEPGYALSDLSFLASRVEVRLYVAERDNVHLPLFAQMIATACSGTGADVLGQGNQPKHAEDGDTGLDVFHQVYSRAQCSIWRVEGAGRMACMLYFMEALDNLMRPVAT
jgi:pimeloyl-ACP methyl ester carboxylesterase